MGRLISWLDYLVTSNTEMFPHFPTNNINKQKHIITTKNHAKFYIIMLVHHPLIISCSSLITQEVRHPLSRTKTWRHRHKPMFPSLYLDFFYVANFISICEPTYPSIACNKG